MTVLRPLAALVLLSLAGCSSMPGADSASGVVHAADEHLSHALGYLGRPLPGAFHVGSLSDSVARNRLQELCMRDAGIHVVQRIKLPAGQAVTWKPTARYLTQHPGADEPVGLLAERYELWQVTQYERAGQATIRRMQSTLRDASTGKTVAVAVNYRAMEHRSMSAQDPHCGDATLAGLSRHVFER